MSVHGGRSFLLSGLLVFGLFLQPVVSLAAAPPGGEPVPVPRWVGIVDARGKARLTWIRDPALAAVRVYRREEGAVITPFRPFVVSRENSWLDESVQAGRTYRYRLIGVAADGRISRPSVELAVRIGATILRPPEPPDWEGYVMIGDGIGLRWSAREGEDVIAWNVYRKEPAGLEFRLVASTRETIYRDSGLTPDRTYVYVLTALDSAFRETPYSQELAVRFSPQRKPPEAKGPADTWVVRRTRLVALVNKGENFALERPADVVVGPVSRNVYLADSGRNRVFVFTPEGDFQRTVGEDSGGGEFKNVLGLATDQHENLYVTDAGAAAVQVFSPLGRPGRRVELPGLAPTGLIDAAIGPAGDIYLVDNYNSRVSIIGLDGRPRTFGQTGTEVGEFSAPTFCAMDAQGGLVVADCLNARVQVFTGSGDFVRAFGRAERGPGGFGRPKGIAVSATGEIYVADSWFNTIQVFDGEGRFVAVLGDETGRPLDLGSPNGVALGRGNRVYIAERLASRLQIRELIDVP